MDIKLLPKEYPILRNFDFKKNHSERSQIRRMKKEWQKTVAIKCQMSLFPGNWHRIYAVYKRKFMQKTTVLN